jgi:hypothetical protein
MDNVQDVLNGRRTILQIDDMVAAMSYDNGDGYKRVRLFYAKTEGSHFPNGNTYQDLPGFPGNVGQTGVLSAQFGWMFNLPYEVIGTFGPFNADNTGGWELLISDPSGKQLTYCSGSDGATVSATTNEELMGDFAGTGFDQALLVDWEMTNGSWAAFARIAGANDPNNPSAGLHSGSPVQLPNNDPSQPLPAIVAGDFYGNGNNKQIAILANDGTTLQFYSVGSDFSLHLITTIQVGPPHFGYIPAAMAAGHFRTPNRDELAIVGQVDNQGELGVASIGITLTPQQSGPPAFAAAVAATYNYQIDHDAKILKVLAQAGPLQNWVSNQDQLVIVKDENAGYGGNIIIGSFDSNFKYTQLSTNNGTDDHGGCIYSLALGNFDNLTFNPENRTITHNPALQIATYWVTNIDDCSVNKLNSQPQMRIWSVDPTNPGDWLHNGVIDHTETGNVGANLWGATMAVGDLQGRSVRLGAPEKVTIQGQIQPDLVLGLPPMQIDEVMPISPLDQTDYPNCQSTKQFCLLNVSANPTPPKSQGFSTAFNFASSSSTSNQQKSTTSWGIAVKASVSEKASFGVAALASISEKVTASAGYAHDNLVANTYDTYTSSSQTINFSTGWADTLIYKARRHNIYYYPVLGNDVCPESTPGCGDEQKTPLYIAFSVPDVSQPPVRQDATDDDWYQPIQEPGNIFSYPGTLQQLQGMFHGTNALNELAQESLSTGSGSFQFGWAGAQNQSKSVGTTNSFSQGLGISVTGKASEGIASAEATASVDVNASESFGSLNVSTQALSASVGITVFQPGFSSTAVNTLGYSYTTYVLGTQPFADVFQTLKPSGPNNQPLDIASTGPMYVAFTANSPTIWYQQQYTLPDVGLNHPERWNIHTNGTLTFNTVDTNAPPEAQPFYHMKGFFITPQADAIAGPNVTVANAGDKLN